MIVTLEKMLGRRLAQARKRNGWTQARLASEIDKGYERSMISHVEAGRATLHFDALVKAARALDVSIDYLAGLTDDPSPADDRSRTSGSGLQRVPLRSVTITAPGQLNIESAPIMGHLAFRREWLEVHGIAADRCSAIEVADDSMEPTLQEGAWSLVDHQRTLRQGNGIFALIIDSELSVRRAVYSDEDWLLDSDNPKVRASAWPSNARVVGQVLWTGRVLGIGCVLHRAQDPRSETTFLVRSVLGMVGAKRSTTCTAMAPIVWECCGERTSNDTAALRGGIDSARKDPRRGIEERPQRRPAAG